MKKKVLDSLPLDFSSTSADLWLIDTQKPARSNQNLTYFYKNFILKKKESSLSSLVLRTHFTNTQF